MTKSLNKSFLEELGKITIEWAYLESIIDVTCAYLFKAALINNMPIKPPRPFNQRIKFIRKNLRLTLFVHIRHEFLENLEAICVIASKRNEIIHAACIYRNDHSAEQIAINIDKSYKAEVLDILTTDKLKDLTSQINSSFRRQLNLQDRMSCILRAHDGKVNIGRGNQIDERQRNQ